jgi:hypothetical protein
MTTTTTSRGGAAGDADCPHWSSTGEDQSMGHDKVFVCDECGVRRRYVRGTDGFDRVEILAPRPAPEEA